MSVPTTEQMRLHVASMAHLTGRNEVAEAALFDAWLAEHDHEVRTQWEMTRKPDPIVIENVGGEPAAVWMERTIRAAKAEAWHEGYQARISGPDINPYRSET